MKFGRFEIHFQYLLTSQQQATRIKHSSDPVREATSCVLCPVENSFIYLPVDQQEFIARSREVFTRENVPTPRGFFGAPIQYFINSQLHYIVHRGTSGRWPVEREVLYGSASKHTADLRITVTRDDASKYTIEPHEPFNIWFEIDHARDERVLHKNWQKVLIALGQQVHGHDLFVQFLYRTKDLSRLETVAAAHWRNMSLAHRSLGNRMSFALGYITPSHLSRHEVVESELVLFKGKSLRVNDPYFHSWTRDGDFHLLNEKVTEEGIQNFETLLASFSADDERKK